MPNTIEEEIKIMRDGFRNLLINAYNGGETDEERIEILRSDRFREQLSFYDNGISLNAIEDYELPEEVKSFFAKNFEEAYRTGISK